LATKPNATATAATIKPDRLKFMMQTPDQPVI
jgi:hypothetical protein